MDETPWNWPAKSWTISKSMPECKHVLIVAGDPSGDQHGAGLAQALKQNVPGLRISALGGTHLRQTADQFVYPLVEVGGFGFWEPLLKLPKLWTAWRQLKSILREDPPAVVIPIDYYGFNIHVARLAKQKGIPVLYYISPQVWASRPHRLKELAKAVTKMLVIFPFEERLYREAGVPVRFIGHPLLDRIPDPSQPNGTVSIGLFPGSRWSVVERHLPILIETARELSKTFAGAEFVLFRPLELAEERYQPFLAQTPWLRVTCDPDYAQRKRLSLAITVSGTASLENALLGIPMIVMYKLSPLTYAIARRLIRVPHVAIPNLLAGRLLVPELLQTDATPEKLAAAARVLLEDSASSQQMRRDLLLLRTQLGERGSTQRAAEEVAQLL